MTSELSADDRRGLDVAIDEARIGRSEGGIPIGSALMIDGEVVGRGHNRRVQSGSAILHGEIDCLENAGRLPASAYRRATLYTTLSPCDMCSGAALLFGIPRIVIGENVNFMGGEAYLESRGVELVRAHDQICVDLMAAFIAAEPDLWNEDIGESST
jgi:cytosine deaminase